MDNTIPNLSFPWELPSNYNGERLACLLKFFMREAVGDKQRPMIELIQDFLDSKITESDFNDGVKSIHGNITKDCIVPFLKVS